MTERYCEGERFADLSFTEETFEDCDFYRLRICGLHLCQVRTGSYHAERVQIRAV